MTGCRLQHVRHPNNRPVLPACPILLLFTQFCLVISVDGAYSDWSPWSACDQQCGSGHRARIRSCSNPEPQFGGMNCTGLGPELDTVACNTDPCPGRQVIG